MISIESLTYPFRFQKENQLKVNWFQLKALLILLDFKRKINWKWIDFNWKPYLSFQISKGKSIESELISIESLTYPFRFQKENQLKVKWFQLKALLNLFRFQKENQFKVKWFQLKALLILFRFQKENQLKVNWFQLKALLILLDFKRKINWKWIDFNWKPYLSF